MLISNYDDSKLPANFKIRNRKKLQILLSSTRQLERKFLQNKVKYIFVRLMPQKYLKILKKSNLTAHKGLRSIEWGVICLAAVNGTRTCSTELLETRGKIILE